MSKKISLVVSDVSNGVFVRAVLLAQVIQKLNYQVEIVGFQSTDTIYAIPPDNITVKSIKTINNNNYIKQIKNILDQITGDIIYAIKPKSSSFGIGLIKKYLSHRPLILDMDDWELSWYGGDDYQYKPDIKQLLRDIIKPQGALRNIDHPLYIKYLEKIVNQANAITIDTEFLQQRFGGTYLPNGKDTDLFNPDNYSPEISKQKYNLSDYKILMFPGAPRPYKGLEDVLTALDLLNRSDLKLIIVGGSPYDDYDDQLMTKWGKWIIKMPRQPITTMPEIIAIADLVVVPQRETSETIAQFPLKLTDGMAMAKPILATKVGDIPQILGGTGYLVDPSSPEQIAAKITEIFADYPQAELLGKQARERCVKLYSVDTMANILAEVINKL